MDLTSREILVVGYSVSHGGTKARRRGETVKGNRVRDENSPWNLVRFPAFFLLVLNAMVLVLLLEMRARKGEYEYRWR